MARKQVQSKGQSSQGQGKGKQNKSGKQSSGRRAMATRAMGSTQRATRPSTSVSVPPASFGTTMTGFKSRIQNIPGGIRVFGDDFLLSASALSNGGSWLNVGAAPVGPSSMGNTAIVDLARIYTQFRVVRAALVYVPSLATSATGQIAMYYRSNRVDPAIAPSNPTFLAWVLSESNGIVGPVWQPQTFEINVGKEWLDTEPFSNVDPNRENDGEVFLATNVGTNAVASPSVGLLKLQYIMEFRGMGRNPKAALIPLPDQVYIQCGFGLLNANVTIGAAANLNTPNANIAGVTVTSFPNANQGDIYKIVLDGSTFSSGTGHTIGGLWRVNFGGGNFAAFTPTSNCITIYGVLISTATFAIYPTFAAAESASTPLTSAYTLNPSSYSIAGMCSMVGSLSAKSQTTI